MVCTAMLNILTVAETEFGQELPRTIMEVEAEVAAEEDTKETFLEACPPT